MDGRRHSVDIPISKTLVALRRVRSLRDPSTISTSKFSSLLDNVNWETNSNTGISLRFLESCHNDHSRPKNPGLYGSRDEHFEEFKPRKSVKKGVIPSINPLEEVESLNELSIGSLRERMERIELKREGFESNHRAIGSDCLSSRSMSVFANGDDDDDDCDDDEDGIDLGMSCCWSGTPTFRETNLSSEIENNPLLSFKRDNNDHNETLPRSETARSLSHKFRPKSFEELVGQSVVARSLLGAICKGRLTSLYLFHGSRGTGKTSASRIFAAALNCLSSNNDLRPCGVCRECIIFFSGRNRDVREVDSIWINRSDRVRSLIKKASIPPVSSRFKVFIVDECHSLHSETWATILHSLDGISRHVIFVMITTELDKLPRSALSRSQRYHFPKIKDSDIAGRLAKICMEEGLGFDRAALDFVASKSSGSMRDAEMMLDQLSLLNRKITVSLAYELIGVVSDDELLDLLDLAISSDSSRTVIKARELMRSRIDPMQLISQLANLIMDILAGCQEGCSEVTAKFLNRHNSEVELQKLSHALKILSETEKQLRMSKNQTTWLTVALLQLSSLESSSSEANDYRGERLDGLVNCSCEEHESDKSGTTEDQRRTLESIWKRTIELCQSPSLRTFLTGQGKLSSLLVSQGVAVVELEFNHPDSVSKAEKSLRPISESLRSVLGCNVAIRINVVPYSSNSIYAKVKNASLRLFGCSRRVRNSRSTPEREIDSDYTEFTSERPMISDRSVIPFSCDCASQVTHNCGERARTASLDMSSENNITPTPVLAPNAFGCNEIAELSSFDQPKKNKGKCFPRKFRARKKNGSTKQTRTVCFNESEEQNKLALAIMRKTSTNLPNENSYTVNNNSNEVHVDENKLGQDSESHCWRASTLQLRKAWRSRNQRENLCLTGWVLPCGGGAK